MVLHGQLGKDARAEGFAKLHSSQVIVGTAGLLGEGIDVKALRFLVLALPISSRTKLLQAVGRVIRSNDDKGDRCFVVDINEDHALGQSSYRKRLNIYHSMEWEVVE